MGEIADMMLDGTMDWETGEWNFEGEDGPGFPMTGAEAADFSRACGVPYRSAKRGPPGEPQPHGQGKSKKARAKRRKRAAAANGAGQP